MGSEDDALKNAQIVDARARFISHNVRCTECGSQSIEDSQADIAILLRKLIRDEIHAGKSDKEIYKKLEDEFGETVLYAPKFDMQTAALWLSPLLVAGVAAGGWAYKKHRQRTNVHIMALNLVRGVPLTPKEKETMLELLTPPPSASFSPWWSRFRGSKKGQGSTSILEAHQIGWWKAEEEEVEQGKAKGEGQQHGGA